MPEADRHDTSAIYKKLTLPELQSNVPQLNWNEYLQATLGKEVQLLPNEQVVAYAMPYLVQMGKILATTDRKIVHNYLIWRLVMSIMTHMIDDYQRVGCNSSFQPEFVYSSIFVKYILRNALSFVRFYWVFNQNGIAGHSASSGQTRKWAWLLVLCSFGIISTKKAKYIKITKTHRDTILIF